MPTRSPSTTRRMLPSASAKTWIGRRLSMQSESAVVSITLRPRSIASRCVISGRNSAFGIASRIAVVDALDPVLRHQDRLGADLERAQRGGRVGGEERVAGAGREDHDPALLEVADRPAADVRLGDLGDRDRRQDARVRAAALERVLQRRARSGASRACRRSRPSPGPSPPRPLPCRGRCSRRRRRSRARPRAAGPRRSRPRARSIARRVEPVLALAHQRLAGELQQNAPRTTAPFGRVSAGGLFSELVRR